MMTEQNVASRPRFALGVYLFLAIILVSYVAVVTDARSEKLGADAWEHHRAVLTLSQTLWRPGNPTYATDEPSIRYSPYSVALALIVRTTGIDAYHALSGAAVFNTLLMIVAIWCWLYGYRLAPAAPMVLLAIVFLYGQSPGYANSFALSDLPWHQVNPSAFAMPLVIFAWVWHRRADGRRWFLAVVGIAILISIAALSHGMTGLLGSFGLFVTGIAEAEQRRARLVAALVCSVAAFGLATLWPWYEFFSAVRGSPDQSYWFNAGILRRMLLVWCLPAIAASLAALSMREHTFIRTSLLATVGLLVLGVAALAVRSPTLARLPLAGLIFPQAVVGVFLHRVGVARLGTWPDRLRRLLDRDRATMSPALVELVVAARRIGLAIPNLWLILREPHLGRRWVAPLMGREDKQPRYWQSYEMLLASHILPGDVVLADPRTGWPVPSFGGRVVAALHWEYFTGDQRRRRDDVTQFFILDTPTVARLEVLDRYGVDWLLVDRDSLSPALLGTLLVTVAIVADDGQRVLMAADRWRAQHRASDLTDVPQGQGGTR